MKNYMLLFCLLTIPGFKSIAQITDTITASAEVKTITRDGLTLHFIRNVPFSSVTQHRLIDAFFTVYPAEMKRFNQNSITEV
jgi:hypothetical protein